MSELLSGSESMKLAGSLHKDEEENAKCWIEIVLRVNLMVILIFVYSNHSASKPS